MIESINNTIWYSIGSFEYLSKLLKKQMEIYRFSNKKREYDKLEIFIKESIAKFNFSEKELETKRSFFDSLINSRTLFTTDSYYDIDKYNDINNLYNSFSKEQIDDLFSQLKLSIKDNINKDPIELNKVLKMISSFQYLELIDNFDLLSLFSYYSKLLNLLNSIIESNEKLFDSIDRLKEPFYPLISKTLFRLYKTNQLNDIAINILQEYEILDLFILFDNNEYLFTDNMITHLLDYVLIKNEEIGSKKLNCFIVFLLALNDPLNEKYIDLYNEYINININSAYLKMASYAVYRNKVSLFIELINIIDCDELEDVELDIYYYFINIIDKGKCEKISCLDLEKDLLDLIDKKDINPVLSFIDKNLKDDYLSKITIIEITKKLLRNDNFNVLEAEYITYYTPINLINYFSKDYILINQEDLAALFCFSVILIKQNLFSESLMLTTKILEKVLDLDENNYVVISNLKIQIKLLKLFLGYKY